MRISDFGFRNSEFGAYRSLGGQANGTNWREFQIRNPKSEIRNRQSEMEE
jgi:hypothetical protein